MGAIFYFFGIPLILVLLLLVCYAIAIWAPEIDAPNEFCEDLIDYDEDEEDEEKELDKAYKE